MWQGEHRGKSIGGAHRSTSELGLSGSSRLPMKRAMAGPPATASEMRQPWFTLCMPAQGQGGEDATGG